MKNVFSRRSLLAISMTIASPFMSGVALADDATAGSLSDFLTRFHADPATVMNELPPKTDTDTIVLFSDEDIETGEYIRKKDSQRRKTMNASSMRSSRSAMDVASGNDNPAQLVDSGSNLINNIYEMDNNHLTSAELGEQPWSDTYWPLYRGALADRYNDPLLENAWPQDFGDRYTFATEDYLPQDYINNGDTQYLSPAEKYDMLVGDTNYTLTEKMWQSGKTYYDRNGEVETWMGLCHGWAPAAYMLPRPTKTLELATPSGETVTFYPSDIKALGTLLWAEASPNVRFIGGRCNTKNPDTDENGRVQDQNCFDTNPGSWHQSVINQIGVSKRSFIIDATYDYQVWNQPVLEYSYTYFNPQTGQTYDNAGEAAIKASHYTQDKFSAYRASTTDSIVGIEMQLTYLVETHASHREFDSPMYDAKQTVTYRYDLELNASGDIIGGEWYTNRHPDFLWTPSQEAKAVSYYNPTTESVVQTQTEAHSDTVAINEWHYYGPYESEVGTFKASMSGNNDADLYVRKSGKPSNNVFDCRPYLSGSSEECELNGAGSYYVGVKGYDSSSSYQLTIEYGKLSSGSAWSQDSLVPTNWQSRAQRAANYSQPLSVIVEQLFEWSSR